MVGLGAIVFTSFFLLTVSFFLVFGLHFALHRPIKEVVANFWPEKLKILLTVFIISKITYMGSKLTFTSDFTPVVYAIEGNTVALFQSFSSPILTVFMLLIYLIGYPLILLLTFFKLQEISKELDVKYAASYILCTLMAFPFFLLTPVTVTGYFLEGVQPLLHENNIFLKQMLITFGNQQNDLPSLHTGLSVVAALYARKYTGRYGLIAGVLTALIILSTFYLGIHWLMDGVVGLLIGVLSFYLVDREIVTFEKVSPALRRSVESYLFKYKKSFAKFWSE